MLSLYFENDTRYYRLTLEKDLPDYWVVVCTYGGKKNNLGNMKKYPFIRLCEALKKVNSIRAYPESHAVLKEVIY